MLRSFTFTKLRSHIESQNWKKYSSPMTSDDFAWKRDATLQARLSAEVEALARQPENKECADCGETRRIRFCSVTLGVFLCNRCYGLHRALGAHVTRCKCLGLDCWKPEEVWLLRSVGNQRARLTFEADQQADRPRPTPTSSDRDVASWIKDKYERRLWYSEGNLSPACAAQQQIPGTVTGSASHLQAKLPAAIAAGTTEPAFDLLCDLSPPLPTRSTAPASRFSEWSDLATAHAWAPDLSASTTVAHPSAHVNGVRTSGVSPPLWPTAGAPCALELCAASHGSWPGLPASQQMMAQQQQRRLPLPMMPQQVQTVQPQAASGTATPALGLGGPAAQHPERGKSLKSKDEIMALFG